MKRTISVMLGKGSINHNSRQFIASNIDSDRSQFNKSYCNIPIKDVYHELFDDALQRYNAKQTRDDRCINNYYEKIRTAKQEKLFYEVIFQVGNMENMASKSAEGQLAAKVLGEFMSNFQERNPYLKVFSAHLHMDEATPHLHVDFVPFTTGSKRGLDTRVSLKQALAKQGFTGGTRGDTEWNQWVRSEKEQLSQVMERHGIEWEQLGTHEEHLSVVDYKKVQRVKEVAALEETISGKQEELDNFLFRLVDIQDQLQTAESKERFIAQHAGHYDNDPEYQLPEPKPLMTAKGYREKVAAPLVQKLKKVIRSILSQFFEKTRELMMELDRANSQIQSLYKRLEISEAKGERLQGIEKDYNRLRRFLGGDRTDEIIGEVKVQEIADKAKSERKSEVFGRERERTAIWTIAGKQDYER
nr:MULTISPECIES: plasmid recombination protein [unclassified Dehalobacter]